MTLETLITIALVAWLLGLFTIRDLVNGILELKRMRQEIVSGSKKKEWKKEDIEKALRKLEKTELKKRLDEGRYNGEWKQIAEKILNENKEEKSDV